MLLRPTALRPGVLLALLAVVGTLGPVLPVDAETPSTATTAATAMVAPAGPGQEPRRTQGLFVDPLGPALSRGEPYASDIGSRAQSLWITPEEYGTAGVQDAVRGYTDRASLARKTPMLTVYGIPGRDCGRYSSANPLTTAAQYRVWIKELTKGLRGSPALVVLEPDALPLFSSPGRSCPTKPAGWLGMLRFASKRLSSSGAWVYLDAGHSRWTPDGTRPSYLKAAGVGFDRGISTNVSNFRPTPDERTYAEAMLRGLTNLGITGKHYVVDTSRNGFRTPPAPAGPETVLNPPWARLGAPPRLRFDGAFDGRLWIKHPGESDGPVNDGPPAGQWCDRLADRLLGAPDSGAC